MFETRRAKQIEKNGLCYEWWTDGFNYYYLYTEELAIVVRDLDGACYAVEHEDEDSLLDEWKLLKDFEQ